MECAFLFSFETKMLYLKVVGFAKVDILRSINHLKSEIKR